MWKSSRHVNAFTRNCTMMIKSYSLSSAGRYRAKDLENALRKYFSPSAWSSPESVWAGRGCSALQRLETPESSRRRNSYWLKTENIWLDSQRLKNTSRFNYRTCMWSCPHCIFGREMLKPLRCDISAKNLQRLDCFWWLICVRSWNVSHRR